MNVGNLETACHSCIPWESSLFFISLAVNVICDIFRQVCCVRLNAQTSIKGWSRQRTGKHMSNLLRASVETRENVTNEGPIFLHICIWDPHARAWLAAVEKFIIGLSLGMSFTDRCICKIFPTKRKVVPIQSFVMVILRNTPNVISLLDKDVRDDVYATGSGKTNLFLCGIVHTKAVYPYEQTSLTVTSPTAGLSFIECHCDGVEKHISIIPQGPVETFLLRSFEEHVANKWVKQILLPKAIGFTCAVEDPIYLVHHKSKNPALSNRIKIGRAQGDRFHDIIVGNVRRKQKR